MTDWIVLVVYLIVSVATYVGLLRLASQDYGVDWFCVLWSLSAFIPGVGQIVFLFLWVVQRDWGAGPEIPRWIKRLAGE